MKPQHKQKSLFIGSIPNETPQTEVTNLIGRFGEVTNATFKAPKKGRDFYSCIIEMSTRGECLDALNAQPLYLAGSRLSIGFYLYKSEIRKEKYECGKRMVYVCNIPLGMTQEQIEDRFNREGKVVEKCLLNKKGFYESPMENYGFLVLRSYSDVDRLLKKKSVSVVFEGKKSQLLLKKFTQKISVGAKKKKKNKNGKKYKGIPSWDELPERDGGARLAEDLDNSAGVILAGFDIQELNRQGYHSQIDERVNSSQWKPRPQDQFMTGIRFREHKRSGYSHQHPQQGMKRQVTNQLNFDLYEQDGKQEFENSERFSHQNEWLDQNCSGAQNFNSIKNFGLKNPKKNNCQINKFNEKRETEFYYLLVKIKSKIFFKFFFNFSNFFS